jgi:hypothetical protein
LILTNHKAGGEENNFTVEKLDRYLNLVIKVNIIETGQVSNVYKLVRRLRKNSSHFCDIPAEDL